MLQTKSYLIGLWFSLRTHASQIWQNPQQLLHSMELPGPSGPRLPVYTRAPQNGGATVKGAHRGLSKTPSIVMQAGNETPSRSQTPVPRSIVEASTRPQHTSGSGNAPPSPTMTRRVSYAPSPTTHHVQPGYTPLIESVDHAIKTTGIPPIQLPDNMSSDAFTRAVAVATVSALRHQNAHAQSPARARTSGVSADAETDGGHGGHDAPSWTRGTSTAVLLTCTALYAIIAGELIFKSCSMVV